MIEREAVGGSPGATAVAEGYLDARESVMILWRGRVVVLAGIVVCALLALARAWMTPPRYEARALLRQVSYEGALACERRVTGEIASAQATASVALLRSQALAARVISDLGLAITAEDLLGRRLTVEQTATNSPILVVRARWTDPATAARLANRYAEGGVSFYRTIHEDDDRTTQECLKARVNEARARLDELRRQRPERGTPAKVEMLEEELARLYVGSMVQLSRQKVDLQIMDPATEPRKPVEPKPGRDALLGAGVGAVLSLIAVFAYAIVGPPTGPSRAAAESTRS